MAADRVYSRYAKEALELLGHAIRANRIQSNVTAQELAERAGISRTLLHRIERGDPKCSIGAVFECAAIIGVPLFETHRNSSMAGKLRETERHLALLPKAVRKTPKVLKDDF